MVVTKSLAELGAHGVQLGGGGDSKLALLAHDDELELGHKRGRQHVKLQANVLVVGDVEAGASTRDVAQHVADGVRRQLLDVGLEAAALLRRGDGRQNVRGGGGNVLQLLALQT